MSPLLTLGSWIGLVDSTGATAFSDIQSLPQLHESGTAGSRVFAVTCAPSLHSFRFDAQIPRQDHQIKIKPFDGLIDPSNCRSHTIQTAPYRDSNWRPPFSQNLPAGHRTLVGHLSAPRLQRLLFSIQLFACFDRTRDPFQNLWRDEIRSAVVGCGPSTPRVDRNMWPRNSSSEANHRDIRIWQLKQTCRK
jgi:hypothetical protein